MHVCRDTFSRRNLAGKQDPPIRGAGYKPVLSRRSIWMEQSQEV